MFIKFLNSLEKLRLSHHRNQNTVLKDKKFCINFALNKLISWIGNPKTINMCASRYFRLFLILLILARNTSQANPDTDKTKIDVLDINMGETKAQTINIETFLKDFAQNATSWNDFINGTAFSKNSNFVCKDFEEKFLIDKIECWVFSLNFNKKIKLRQSFEAFNSVLIQHYVYIGKLIYLIVTEDMISNKLKLYAKFDEISNAIKNNEIDGSAEIFDFFSDCDFFLTLELFMLKRYNLKAVHIRAFLCNLLDNSNLSVFHLYSLPLIRTLYLLIEKNIIY
ncbi:hypothetical protein EDEG_01251 [Edhazardia aedis USNM 41457]|uniref:Uncharacterized protein n=1 Tax=Edhazardia aedis (strain USNM 41457) TaxID=1003232 RepID=J9DAK6_EDHAE|nr:hypothetical protein EDEG_01251 [Edhazardia aedis USNM 41457]|eukprot:EJW04539.1 hypothetical protein EDEG_01251 [Edhazardia aedis USNM 41457]